MQETEILVQYKFFPIKETNHNHKLDISVLGTFISNMLYYGYIPSKELFEHLVFSSEEQITSYWQEIYPVLNTTTGSKHNIQNYVLYKNFPNEVIEKSIAEYWINQICVYLGFEHNIFTNLPISEYKINRENIKEISSFKTLHPIEKNKGIEKIVKIIVEKPVRWSNDDKEIAIFIFNHEHILKDKSYFRNLSNYHFKENGLNLFLNYYQNHNPIMEEQEEFSNIKKRIPKDVLNSLLIEFKDKKAKKVSCLENLIIKDATDIARLYSLISGNKSYYKKINFKSLPKCDRKSFLKMLENSNNLLNDAIEHQENFKKMLSRLHPGDFKQKFENVCYVYDILYNKKKKNFNSILEEMITLKNEESFSLLKPKTGVFIRRFHQLFNIFDEKAIDELFTHLEKCSKLQLVKLKKYILTVNQTEKRIVAPNGNWNNIKILNNDKKQFSEEQIVKIVNKINEVLKEKITNNQQKKYFIDPKINQVKIQDNNQKLTSYGRGTVFDIPENITYIRTSSFWNIESSGTFLDNTWNFFDENWKPISSCCWNKERFLKEEIIKPNIDINKKHPETSHLAVFSGDAVNTNKKAAQLIDIYLDKLENSGIRYALWSILSYNKIAFSKFNEAHAGLQMGTEPQKDKLFDPSNVQFSFPLIEDQKSKIVAYIDVKLRKIIYCDANLKLDVSSGTQNQDSLSEIMPIYVQYLNSLPSYKDLLESSHDENGTPVIFDDENIDFENEIETVYLFKSSNIHNIYKNVKPLEEIING